MKSVKRKKMFRKSPIPLIAILFLVSNVSWAAIDFHKEYLRVLAVSERGRRPEVIPLAERLRDLNPDEHFERAGDGEFTSANVESFFMAWEQIPADDQNTILTQLSRPVLGKSMQDLLDVERGHLVEIAGSLYVGWNSFSSAEQTKILAQLNRSGLTLDYLRRVNSTMAVRTENIPRGNYSAPETLDMGLNLYDGTRNCTTEMRRHRDAGYRELKKTVFLIATGGPGTRLERSLQAAIQRGDTQASALYRRAQQRGLYSKVTFPTGPVSENSPLIYTLETLTNLSNWSGVDFPVLLACSADSDRAVIEDLIESGYNLKLKNLVIGYGSMYPSILPYGYFMTYLGSDGLRQLHFSPGGTLEVLKASRRDVYHVSSGQWVNGEEFIEDTLTAINGQLDWDDTNFAILYGDDPCLNNSSFILTALGGNRSRGQRGTRTRRADLVGIGIPKTGLLTPYGGTFATVNSGRRQVPIIVEAGPRERKDPSGKSIKGDPDMRIPFNMAEDQAEGFFPFNTGVIFLSGRAYTLATVQPLPIRLASRELPDRLLLNATGLTVTGVPYRKPEEYLTDVFEAVGGQPGVNTMVAMIHPSQYGATKQWPHVVRERLKYMAVSVIRLEELGIHTPYRVGDMRQWGRRMDNYDLADPKDVSELFNKILPKFKTPIELGRLFRLLNEPKDVTVKQGTEIHLNGEVEIQDGAELRGKVILPSGGIVMANGILIRNIFREGKKTGTVLVDYVNGGVQLDETSMRAIDVRREIEGLRRGIQETIEAI